MECPVCHEKLSESQDACPRCGFRLIGATQQFVPIDPEVTAKVAALASTPALEVVKGPYSGETFFLGQGTFQIGREPSCDVFLSNMTVSRLHATITIDGGDAVIHDEGSLNGTWVDGEVVEQALLHAGTRVQVGTFDMVFRFVDE